MGRRRETQEAIALVIAALFLFAACSVRAEDAPSPATVKWEKLKGPTGKVHSKDLKDFIRDHYKVNFYGENGGFPQVDPLPGVSEAVDHEVFDVVRERLEAYAQNPKLKADEVLVKTYLARMQELGRAEETDRQLLTTMMNSSDRWDVPMSVLDALISKTGSHAELLKRANTFLAQTPEQPADHGKFDKQERATLRKSHLKDFARYLADNPKLKGERAESVLDLLEEATGPQAHDAAKAIREFIAKGAAGDIRREAYLSLAEIYDHLSAIDRVEGYQQVVDLARKDVLSLENKVCRDPSAFPEEFSPQDLALLRTLGEHFPKSLDKVSQQMVMRAFEGDPKTWSSAALRVGQGADVEYPHNALFAAMRDDTTGQSLAFFDNMSSTTMAKPLVDLLKDPYMPEAPRSRAVTKLMELRQPLILYKDELLAIDNAHRNSSEAFQQQLNALKDHIKAVDSTMPAALPANQEEYARIFKEMGEGDREIRDLAFKRFYKVADRADALKFLEDKEDDRNISGKQRHRLRSLLLSYRGPRADARNSLRDACESTIRELQEIDTTPALRHSR